MKLTVLGCGTSSGVPRIGNDWGQCDRLDSRNRRSRASVIIETASTRILVDTSPDMRMQLLDANIDSVDAIIWTHDHADHTHGLDDVRQLFHQRQEAIQAYARPFTLSSLQQRFAYAFHGRQGYPSIISLHSLEDSQRIGDIDVSAVDMPHGGIFSSGLRFEADGQTFGYATDFHTVTEDMLAFFSGLDLWVVDALRRNPHPTHPHLELTLAAIAHCKPKQAVLTHMDQSMDYATVLSELPAGVIPGYDGLQL